MRIFISYRREDSAGYAGRMYDTLRDRFGERSVFIDVDGIRPGDDFADAIGRTLRQCDVLLAVIGPNWAQAADTEGCPRLFDAGDFVRLEIESALAIDLRTVPVLVGRAQMPNRAVVPESMWPFLRRQATELNDVGWNDDLRALIDALRPDDGETPDAAAPQASPVSSAVASRPRPAAVSPRGDRQPTAARTSPLRLRSRTWAIGTTFGIVVALAILILVAGPLVAGRQDGRGDPQATGTGPLTEGRAPPSAGPRSPEPAQAGAPPIAEPQPPRAGPAVAPGTPLVGTAETARPSTATGAGARKGTTEATQPPAEGTPLGPAVDPRPGGSAPEPPTATAPSAADPPSQPAEGDARFDQGRVDAAVAQLPLASERALEAYAAHLDADGEESEAEERLHHLLEQFQEGADELTDEYRRASGRGFLRRLGVRPGEVSPDRWRTVEARLSTLGALAEQIDRHRLAGAFDERTASTWSEARNALGQIVAGLR